MSSPTLGANPKGTNIPLEKCERTLEFAAAWAQIIKPRAEEPEPHSALKQEGLMKDHHYSQDSMEVSGINNQKRSENISSTGAERSAAGRAKAEERSESAETKKAEALARREAAQSEGRGRSLDESA